MLYVIEETNVGGEMWLVNGKSAECVRQAWAHETGNPCASRVATLHDIASRIECRYVTAEAMIEADAVLSAYRRSVDLCAVLQ